MKPRNLFILILITALTVTGALFLSRHKEQAGGSSSELVFPGLADEITTVRYVVIRNKDYTVTLERLNDAWVAVEKNQYPADVNKVRQLFTGLAELRYLEKKTGNPELYPRLGVEDISVSGSQAMEVSLQTAERKNVVSLLVGHSKPAKTDPTLFEIYMRRPDEKQAWLVMGFLPRVNRAVDWLDRQIIDIEPQRIRQVEVSRAGEGSIRIFKNEQSETTFQLAGLPENSRIKSVYALNSMASVLQNLSLEDVMVTPPEEELQEPQAIIQFSTFDNLQVILNLFGEKGAFFVSVRSEMSVDAADRQEQQEKDADVAEESERINSRTDKWLYKIPQYRIDNLLKNMADLVEPVETPEEMETGGEG
jgi:hypothetical protein